MEDKEFSENIIDKNIVMKSFFWRYMERCGAQGVSFIISIVLARILNPEIYGTVALVMVFTAILQVFVDSGMGNALIQKRDADELDFSSVFFLNMGTCGILYIVMFFMAPFIARFYGRIELISIIRVLCISLIIFGMKNVQQAYVSHHMLFRKFFFSTIGGTIISAVVGIALAHKGYGVWALVWQQVINSVVDTMILWRTVGWRPRIQFSIERVKELSGFGSKILMTSLLQTVYDNIRQLFIGRWYTGSDLALYNRGKQIPQFVVTNINSSIDSVLFPAFSKKQDKSDQVKIMARRAIKVSTYILTPLLIGLAVISSSIVRIIFTEKWIGAAPYMCLFCVADILYPIHTTSLNVINAMGRSDIFFRQEVIKDCFGIVMLILTIRINVFAVAVGMVISAYFSLFVNAWPNRKLINYHLHELLIDVLPNIILSIAMGCVMYLAGTIVEPPVCRIILQMAIGAIFYLTISRAIHMESYEYCLANGREFIRGRKKYK